MQRALEPIRVLIAMDRLGYGDGRYHGAGRLVIDWTRALQERGVEVTTVVLRSPGTFEKPEGLEVELLDRGRYDLRTIGDFRRLFHERGIQVAHLQGFGSLTFGRMAALTAGIPTIAHIHADHGAETGGYPWFVKVADRTLARYTSCCIAVSEDTARFATVEQGFDPARVEVWHNPVDLSQYQAASPAERSASRATLGLPEDVPVAVAVARLDLVKGIDLLVEAWPGVVERVPDARLVLVGEGPMRDELTEALRAHGVLESVDFLGYRSDVAFVLHSADVLALPSRSEGMPLAALEALASGLPVVGHAVGGIPELVVDGVNGRLVPPEPPLLADALADVLGNRVERDRLAAEARASVAPLGLRAYAARLEDLYRRLADSTGSPDGMVTVQDGLRGGAAKSEEPARAATA
ncbi:MAG: glycosyltransferase family 4 protein [Gemmatimonadales bacterium]|jgi:glycosyltransferase involved in cell wall biosynthesis